MAARLLLAFSVVTGCLAVPRTLHADLPSTEARAPAPSAAALQTAPNGAAAPSAVSNVTFNLNTTSVSNHDWVAVSVVVPKPTQSGEQAVHEHNRVLSCLTAVKPPVRASGRGT